MNSKFTPICNLLTQELKKRQLANRKYSLRAFAADLEIDPSSLSKIIKGMRIPSEETRTRLLKAMQVGPEDLERVNRWVEKQAKGAEFEVFQEIHVDNHFEPEHVAALEALRIPSVTANPSSVSNILNLDPERVEKVLRELESMGLVAFGDFGTAIFSPHNSTFSISSTSVRRREIQRYFLEAAAHALNSVPFEERENSTLTMAIPVDRLDLFKEELARFRYRINRIADRRISHANKVYNFVFGVYPVDFKYRKD
jgi:transcriptional regulator with XRE-family HTH domain